MFKYVHLKEYLLFKYFKYQCLKTFKAENCDIGFHHLSRKTYYWNKTSVRMSTCIAIIDSKTVGTPATQPHTHTDTDGMMSDPTRADTHHVLQPTSRAKMTCPDRCAPPTPAPDSSRSVYREMPDARMEGNAAADGMPFRRRRNRPEHRERTDPS